MSTGIVFLVIGLVCGHAWPHNIGLVVTVAALVAILTTWYADHSPDEVFDLLEDYNEKLISYVFLPWASGVLVAACWTAF